MLSRYHPGDFFACSFLGWLVINLYDGLLVSNSFAPIIAATADQRKENSWKPCIQKSIINSHEMEELNEWVTHWTLLCS